MSVKLESAGLNRSQKIIKIANLNPVYSKSSDTIIGVVDKMITTDHRWMPVVSKRDELVGLLTSSNILDAFLRKHNFKEKISSLMIRDIIFCKADDLMGIVLQKFKISRRGGLPIVDGKKLVGMVTERDFVKPFSNIRFNMRIEDIMTPKPFFIQPMISILDCLKTMVNTRYRRLPVVQGRKLIGIVTSADMLKYIKENDYDFAGLDEGVESLMKRDVFTISKDKDVSDAIKLMRDKDVGGIIVVDGDRLDGIITERDILEEIV